MPSAGLDVATMRRAVEALRREGAYYPPGATYVCAVDPWWLATPARRGYVWRTLARLAELERDA